jgi:hypothetical protein
MWSVRKSTSQPAIVYPYTDQFEKLSQKASDAGRRGLLHPGAVRKLRGACATTTKKRVDLL